MTLDDVRSCLTGYVQRTPGRAQDVADLFALIDQGANVLSRSEFRGHATASALLLNPQGQLLLIKHNALNRWLQPGGHLDAKDASPFAGALRELSEETGIDPTLVRCAQGYETVPLWVDRHWIPANPKKNEPRHEHWDFRYLFLTDAPVLTLQANEVSAYAWRPPKDLSVLNAKLIRNALGI